MSRPRWIFLGLSLSLLVPLVAGTLRASSAKDDPSSDSLFKYLSVFMDTFSRVRDSYVEPPNVDQLLSAALDGAAEALDPFSVYVPADAVTPYQQARTVGTRHSGLTVLKENGVMFIAGVLPDSPGAAAGVRVGDLLAEIDRVETRVMPLWKAQEAFAGAVGTELALKLIRLGEVKELRLKLATFSPAGVKKETVRGVGVVRVPTIGESTAEQVKRALSELAGAGIDKLVLDLRGSSVTQMRGAYDVAKLFSRGELGSLRRRGEVVTQFENSDPTVWSGKVVVLIDRTTLGGNELLASVLKQKIDAPLVGERSFGYAGEQTSIALSSGGRLFLTDAFYAGPDGKPLREKLAPDHRVDFIAEEEGKPPIDAILERGISVLLGEETPAAKAAA